MEPFGEDRADIRAKLNTQAIATAHLNPESFNEVYDLLDNYTGDQAEDPDQLEVNPKAAAAIRNKTG